MKEKLVIIILLIFMIIIVRCDKKPSEPEHLNPFDEQNAQTGGDPFKLTAAIANGGVTLSWTIPQIQGIVAFRIYRSASENTGYMLLQTVDKITNTYVDKNIVNGYIYWYRISSVNSKGKETDYTNTATVNIKTAPAFVINGGDEYTPSIIVNLTILDNTAIEMIISNNIDFSGSNWESYSSSKDWTLTTGPGEKVVFLKVRYDDSESLVVSDTINIQLINPGIVIANDSTYTSTRNVELSLSASGSNLQMKVSDDTTFNGIGWQTFSPSHSFQLSQGAGGKKIYAIFKNDFEVESEIVFDTILPLPMNPSILISNGMQYTPSRNVQINISATGRNLQMKVSDDSTFTGVNWTPYTSLTNVQLSTGEGEKRVYAEFKNDFEIESERVFDSILPKPVENYSFLIEGGADATNTSHVILTVTAENATHMITANSEDFIGSSWEIYQTSKNWTLNIEGKNKNYNSTKNGDLPCILFVDLFDLKNYNAVVFMRFRNDFGVESQIVSDDILIEIISSIKINNDSLYTSFRSVNLTLYSEYADEMIIGDDSTFAGNAWESYQLTKSWTLPEGLGPHYVYAKFRNNSGAVSSVYYDEIFPQPINPSILIANGAQFTSTRNVQINISASGSNLQMKVSDDSTFSGLSWQVYSSTTNYQLSTGEGEKKVHAKFKNDFEIESEVVFDTIFPQPMNPSISIAGGVQYAPTIDVQLNLSVLGSNLQMKISEDSTFIGLDWQTYSSSMNFQLSAGEGDKKVYAKFKNDFEIESTAVQDVITLDTTPPIPVLVVLPDSGITNETTFQFDPTSSSDNLAPSVALQISFDWDNDGYWDIYPQPLSITNHKFTTGGGDKIVKMQLKDGAGWTADITVPVFVNTRPMAAFTAINDLDNFLLYHFDASASGDYEDGKNLQYRWDWENDGNWDTDFSISATASFLYDSAGTYSATLQVQDSRNLTNSIIKTVHVGLVAEWITIPAGDYTYGQNDEIRSIPYNYRIMKYEVTNAQYKTYLEQELAIGQIIVSSTTVQGFYNGLIRAFYHFDYSTFGYNVGIISWNGTNFDITAGYEDHPVIHITWYGAASFASHYECRLTTEEEWEKAARGNTGWDYPWGDFILGNRANYWYSGDPFDNGTTPVGYYNGSNHGGFQTFDNASPFGLYDMAGNVCEWSESQIVQGGCYWDDATSLQSWKKGTQFTLGGHVVIGFRCVKD